MYMPKMKLIKNHISHAERIQNRIDAFAQDIMECEDHMEYVRQILEATYQYMLQYEDEDIQMSALRIKESIFYVDHFMSY